MAAVVREADLTTDIETILDLYLEEAGDHVERDPQRYAVPDRDALRAELIASAGRYKAIVAEHGGRIVGFATANISALEGSIHRSGGMQLWISDIVVTRPCRGIGIGSALLNVIEDWGRREGATSVALSVDATNDVALQLYRDRGYAALLFRLGKTL